MTHLCQLNQTPVFTNSRRSAQQPLTLPQLQRGASLLEGIAYLGIAAVVVLGAVSLLGGAFTGAKTNQAIEETVALRTAVRKLYVGQLYTETGMIENLIKANAVPGTLARTGTENKVALANSWGGTVSVAAVAGGFQIIYPKVPKDVCINMLNGSNGWSGITLGNETQTTFPISISRAAEMCANDSANELKFTSI
ncbi:type 4 pilus major pilin [Pseudoduganella violacea]|uniref:Type 4 secretion system PilS N-terminal domain-containing protein n=1 Tax=Pseudoduganella violacea TaxID=1715466 RepID=A0A7W5BFQ9_9BURK|nr:type 4 pilus major pilin [Pseudoduganella violacea]MBB3122334.1 hypothetical protein [Pseudoduganella violacea]